MKKRKLDFERMSVAERRKRPELARFASWFLQDWELIYSAPEDGAARYLQRLSAEHLYALEHEVDEFIDEFHGRPDRDVVLAWVLLGGESARGDGVLPMLGDLRNRLRLARSEGPAKAAQRRRAELLSLRRSPTKQ